MKRMIDIDDIDAAFSKKLKLEYTFDICDCYASVGILEYGMGSKQFIKETAIRYTNYAHLLEGTQIQTLLQQFFCIYDNKPDACSSNFYSEQQMQLIKLIYHIDTYIIQLHTSQL
jgi:hypothetical protein